MKLSKRAIRVFQNRIFSWWARNKRDLPWRHTHDPYTILVSEVMLQQTQVSRVIAKYEEFLYFFPDVYTLSHATAAKVLRVWRGMGYNRRALYLRKAAKMVVEKWKGEFSESERQLSTLPGVGTYTARALLVFAFKKQIWAVDTNIRKIITHFFFKGKPQKESVIDDVAQQLVPENKSWEWHQALMDYAALRLRDVKRPFAQGKFSKKLRRSIPFRETNRFYRGRIVDRLRGGQVGEKKLLKELVGTYHKSEDLFQTILVGLERDGLIARTKNNMVSLPA